MTVDNTDSARTPEEWDRWIEQEGKHSLATTGAIYFELAAKKIRQHNSPGRLIEAQSYAVIGQQYLDELRRRKGVDKGLETA